MFMFAIWFFILATPGIMPISPESPPILLIWSSWSRRSERSNEPFPHLLGGLLHFRSVEIFGRAFDETDDVAHAEDTAGDARGIEVFERIELFADADQLDRLAGDGAHGERRTAAAVAVDAREHDAGDGELGIERARGIHRVLAGQRVGDEQDFVGLRERGDIRRFLHQLFIDSDAARRVEHQHVVAAAPRFRRARAW
jgi:hypothetical protein